ILSGFLPAPLPPNHLTESPKDLYVVRKFALSLNQFLTRPRIIQITPEKVIRLREMCFARIRLETNRSLYTALSQRQTSFSVIVIREIHLIVRKGELAVGKQKRRIERYRLVKEFHRFK